MPGDASTAYLSTDYDVLLAELVETFIPKTDTLGAKDLGVHQFIKTMLKDCYTPKAQADFHCFFRSVQLIFKDSRRLV